MLNIYYLHGFASHFNISSHKLKSLAPYPAPDHVRLKPITLSDSGNGRTGFKTLGSNLGFAFPGKSGDDGDRAWLRSSRL